MKKIKIFFTIILINFYHGVYGLENISSGIIKSEKEDFTLSLVAEGLEYPWALAVLPGDEGLLVTERTGKMMIIDNTSRRYLSGVPAVASSGQGGLLDVIADIDFINSRTIFFSYSVSRGGSLTTEVARARLSGDRLEDKKVIFSSSPASGSTIHFGSRLSFDDISGKTILVTLGDRGQAGNAQDLAVHPGKVIRINRDGTVPPDNPFTGKKGAREEIFTYGHRNPQGLVFDRKKGIIWMHEHGPRGGDELNVLKKGLNYGWPEITYGINYSGTKISDYTEKEGMEKPALHWTPSIAPSGLDVYYGSLFPSWNGNLFAGALAGRQLVRIETEGEKAVRQEILLGDKIGRIRDVKVSHDGSIYLLTDSRDGRLYRITK